jgi:hypothetical protein
MMSEPNMPNSVPTINRYPHQARYVEHENVERFMALGWEWTSALVDTHHGEHAALMVWPHDTEPPNE